MNMLSLRAGRPFSLLLLTLTDRALPATLVPVIERVLLELRKSSSGVEMDAPVQGPALQVVAVSVELTIHPLQCWLYVVPVAANAGAIPEPDLGALMGLKTAAAVTPRKSSTSDVVVIFFAHIHKTSDRWVGSTVSSLKIYKMSRLMRRTVITT